MKPISPLEMADQMLIAPAVCTVIKSYNACRRALHDIGGAGGLQLADVASKFSRESLLEPLVDPNAKIAPGYGISMLELHDDRTLGVFGWIERVDRWYKAKAIDNVIASFLQNQFKERVHAVNQIRGIGDGPGAQRMGHLGSRHW